MDGYTEENFFDILTKNAKIPFEYQNPCDYKCINPGEVQGELIGGNLSIFCGLMGTPYMPDLTGKILFLEDVGEPLYKIDRMITQLKLGGVFEKISGLLFAEFSSTENITSVYNVVNDLVSDLNIPIGFGFPAGHEKQKATLPLGVQYLFNSKDFKLQLTEDYLN